MFSRTEVSREMKIVGKRLTMSFENDKTGPLFGSFMPHRKSIPDRTSTDTLCVQNYPEGFFRAPDLHTTFEKWAAVEVSSFDHVPEGMETAVIPSGLYAIFLYKGTAENVTTFFSNIYMNWFPSSGFVLDVRPHFDVIGIDYKKDDPDSTEEIWIPVRARQ